MNENPELTPAVLEELRTALLTRQAELQREITTLRQSEQGTVDHPEDVTTVDSSDAGYASVDLQDREDTSDALGVLQAQLVEVEHALPSGHEGARREPRFLSGGVSLLRRRRDEGPKPR